MACWKAGARRQFDAWSASYDRSLLQRLFFTPSHNLLLQAVELRPDMRVLDVGCGTGKFAGRLVAACPDLHVVGLDLSESMLERAAANCRSLGHAIEFVHGDSEHLPFSANTFDLVTCIHSFHHYPHQRAVVEEMMRVAKPGGRVAILDANRDGWWGWFLFDGIVTAIEGGVHHCSARQFREMFRHAGFEQVVQSTGGSVAPFLLTTGVAHKQPACLPQRPHAKAA